MNARIIGLVGFAGSGKDSVAKNWIDQAGFRQVSFARALYQEVSEAFDVSIEWLQNRDNKEKPSFLMTLSRCGDKEFAHAIMDIAREENPRLLWTVEMNKPRSPREILQWWGTEYRRAQDQTYWINKTAATIRSLDEFPLVATDVRFENEIDLITSLGGTLVRVSRPGVLSINNHVSEKYARDGFCHFELYNDGTLDDLAAKSMSFLDEISWMQEQSSSTINNPCP